VLELLARPQAPWALRILALVGKEHVSAHELSDLLTGLEKILTVR
jgi:hypothetical protein